MDCSLPGSSVHEILQARILEWVAISFSRGSFRPRNRNQVSCIAGRFFTDWAMREALYPYLRTKKMSAQKLFLKRVSWSVGIKGNLRTFYFKRKRTLLESEVFQMFPSVQLKDNFENPRNPFMPAALRWNSYQNNLLILDICDLMYLLSRNSRKLDLSLNKQGKKFRRVFQRFISHVLIFLVCWWASLVAQMVKNLPAIQETLGQEDPLEGNDNPLQYSCLENPMDRGAW